MPVGEIYKIQIVAVACRIFCTSVIETTALALSDPDGAVRA
jgi:hypothetical protein